VYDENEDAFFKDLPIFGPTEMENNAYKLLFL
jgi:hypothetical protein